jgi:tetratricopeptide (TPR) repeat protein
LRAELTPAERERLGRPPTVSAEAFALYLRGRLFWNQRTPEALERAIDCFERAIAADPGYAAAYAGLAGVYSLQGLSGAAGAPEARERTMAAVLRALELDDGNADAYAVLGSSLSAFDWDADEAERALLRAIELDPSHSGARHHYGNLLAMMGRVDEAVAQKAIGVQRDPLNPALSETLAFALLRVGRLEEARRHLSDALELDSTYWRAHAVLGLLHEATGDFDEAIRTYERANELARASTHRTKADIARVLARAGRPDEARRLVDELRADAATTGIEDWSVATALLALGEVDEAFAVLEEAYRLRRPGLPFLVGDRRFESFYPEPRFLDLIRRIGMWRGHGPVPPVPEAA